MESLPVEINCQILSSLTDPHDIANLMKSNAYLAEIAKDCITKLSLSHRNAIIPLNFIMMFSHIQDVNLTVRVNDSGLFALANLKMLRQIDILYPDLDDVFEPSPKDAIDDITEFYLSLGNRSNKRFYFRSPIHDYQLLIRDKSLTFDFGEHSSTYSKLIGLMRAINERDGLVTISYYPEIYDKVIKVMGRNLPKLRILEYYAGLTRRVNVHLRLTNIDTVTLHKSKWHLNAIRLIQANMLSIITDPTLFRQVIVHKEVKLELPVNLEYVSALIDIYPNIRQLAIYEEDFNVDVIRSINLLLDRGISVIIYTRNKFFALTGNPNIIFRLIDE